MVARVLIALEAEVNPFFFEAILCVAGHEAPVVSTPTAVTVLK